MYVLRVVRGSRPCYCYCWSCSPAAEIHPLLSPHRGRGCCGSGAPQRDATRLPGAYGGTPHPPRRLGGFRQRPRPIHAATPVDISGLRNEGLNRQLKGSNGMREIEESNPPPDVPDPGDGTANRKPLEVDPAFGCAQRGLFFYLAYAMGIPIVSHGPLRIEDLKPEKKIEW